MGTIIKMDGELATEEVVEEVVEEEEVTSVDILSIRLTSDGKIGIFMPLECPVPAVGLIQILQTVIQKLLPEAKKQVDAQQIITASEGDLKKIEQTMPAPKKE